MTQDNKTPVLQQEVNKVEQEADQVEPQVQEMSLSGEEAKLHHFILQNLPMIESYQNPGERSYEIVKMIRFYFTSIYKNYEDAQEVK